MYPFVYNRARDERSALAMAASGGRYIAGGTTMVDLMRQTVERPKSVVDITALPYRDIRVDNRGVHVGALVTMTDLAADHRVRSAYPVVSQSLELSASAQLRNMATMGGNLLQRTRCFYFRDTTAPCNKRNPGSGCPALTGTNRTHAILGGSDHCVATHPSDVAVALVALDATVDLVSAQGNRTVPVAGLFLLPGSTPEREHPLRPGELITGLHIPAGPHTARSGYLKVRDRVSYEFALASAAVALDIRDNRIRDARVAVGGVGTIPWRLPAVERVLIGRTPGPQTWLAAAARAAEGAHPLAENGFKADLLVRTVARQLATVGETS
jgi:xanthine dehydrogenase YagS FAD-binding subunit